MKRYILVSIMTALVFALSASVANAATYYVALSGNNSNSGTINAPFRTINHGISVLQPGDTLIVRNGIYTEAINGLPSGTSGMPITIMAENPRGAIISPPRGATFVIVFGSGPLRDSSGNVVTHTNPACLAELQRRGISNRQVQVGVNHVTIANFALDGSNVNSVIRIAGGVDNTVCYPDYSHQPNNISIIGNEIMNGGGYVNTRTINYSGVGTDGRPNYRFWAAGISSSRVNDIYFAYNIVHSNGVTDYDHGIYHFGRGGIIENNIVYNNVGSGIKVGWGSTTENVIVRNNYVYDNNVACDIRRVNPTHTQADGRGISIHAGRNIEVYNNLVVGWHVAGIDVIYNIENVNINNNTVHVTRDCGTAYGIRASTTSSDTAIRNNIVSQQSQLPSSRYNYSIAGMSNAQNVLIERNFTACGTNPEIVIIDAATGIIRDNFTCVDQLFVNPGERNYSLVPSSPAIGAGADLSKIITSDDLLRPPSITRPTLPRSASFTTAGRPRTPTPPRPIVVTCSSGAEGIDTAIGCIPLETQALIVFFLRWSMGIAGGVSVYFIAESAYAIATSKGDPKKVQAGRERMTGAISGLVLMILAVFVLRFIGVDLLGIF